MKKLPDFFHEKKLWKKKYLVIGIDEVGRGCLAGPLVVGAVTFSPPSFFCKEKLRKGLTPSKKIKYSEHEYIDYLLSLKINDSKKLSYLKREKLAEVIKKEAFAYSIAKISPSFIDKYGITKATQKAVRKAIKKIMNQESKIKNKNNKFLILNYKFYILMDAFYIKYIKGIGLKHQKAIIHGDGISMSIAAASIIAKEYRDKLMIKLSEKHKEYKWNENKGYGTKTHIEALKKHGKCIHHRELFLRKLTGR